MKKTCFTCIHFDGDMEGETCKKRIECLYIKERYKKYWKPREPYRFRESEFIQAEEMII